MPTVKKIPAAPMRVESPNTRQTRSQTKELISAFENLDIEQADKLIFDKGIDPSVIDSKLLTRSLWQAVKMQNAPLVRELLKYNPNLKTDKEPMLSVAVRQFNAEIAMMLIKAGADVNETDYLHAVTLCEDSKMHEIAVALMDHGADLEARDYNNRSVLYYAVGNEAVGIVEELLKRGIKIRDDDDNYEIILKMVENSSKAAEMLKLLFDYECIDIKKREELALSAMLKVIENEPDGVAKIKKLIDVGAPVDRRNAQGCTPLHCAVFKNRIEMVELLVNYGADVNKKTHRGTTPIMIAAVLRDPTVAVLLIKRGANIHQCDNYCRYPIHKGCESGFSKFTRLLMYLGANVDVVDANDFTPFSLLREPDQKIDIFIKHFAFLTAKGISFNSTDLAAIQNDRKMLGVYEMCLKELQRMKENECMNGVTYFDLLNGKIEKLSLLTKNSKFVEQFYKHQKNANGKIFRWLKYSGELKIAFQMAEKRRDLLICKEKIVQSAYNDVFPQIILDKIARFLALDELSDFKKNFYLSLFSKRMECGGVVI